jgi:hypothetical protein
MAKTGPKPKPPEERFWPKVDKAGPIPANRPELGPCWLWTSIKTERGYGYFIANTSRAARTPNGGQKRVPAHRYAYELVVGPVPEGLELDHLCRNHSCVNPAHLEPVTHQENVRRGMAGPMRRRTTCGRCGRPWSSFDKRGWGKCGHCFRTVYIPRYEAKKNSKL